MKSLLSLVLACIVILFASCSKSKNELNENPSLIKLNECSVNIISGENIKLCFDAVVSDSRCPANAMCIWQGMAVAKFSFTRGHETSTFNLSTLRMQGSYNKDTTIAGYKIEFINLYPYPGLSPAPVPDNEIKAEVKVYKL